MTSTKIEFAVQMTCKSCVEAVKRSLESPDIRCVEINLENNSVVVDSTLSTLDIQKRLESTGRKVIVRGYDGKIAAVAILDTGEAYINGVVRFVQVTQNSCIIDGTVDGLSPGDHQLTINECGDLSNCCENVGNLFSPDGYENDYNYGDLGLIKANHDGRASFRLENNIIKLSEVIGRSLVVQKQRKPEVCGIIARSAGLFENPKTICACDGVTLWDETNKPILNKPSL